MGSTIAQVFATGDIDVALFDIEESALARAMGRIHAGLQTLASVGKLSSEQVARALSHIHLSQDMAAAAEGVAFAIEAVPEVPAIKRTVLAQMADHCADETVIASNTSFLNIFDLADVKRPERLVIAHFFGPAHIIPLVEIVPGPQTSPETVTFTAQLLERVGKSPLVMKKFGPGFIVNRIQIAIVETCLEMIEEGLVEPAEIDRAVKLSLGVRLPIVGVVQNMDFQGLDMLLNAMKNSGKVYSFVEEKVKQDQLGAKTSRGIYDYQGRSEIEILRKRDELYLKMLDYLREIHAFDPI
jgi:3-hydroxyacyl-CoA dehydrogenase